MKPKPNLVHENTWRGNLYKFEIFLSDDFSNIKNVTQVYGVIFDSKERILLVAGRQKFWILPGGSVEEGETFLDTLHREVYEESAVFIDENSINPFFYQNVYFQSNGKWTFECTQLRYLANIKQIDKFISDPGGHVRYQEFVDIDRLDKYLRWGETTKFIKNQLRKL